MIFYLFMRAYVRTVLFFYFKKLKVIGLENIPKNEAVLFVANHENALLDSITLACTNNNRAYVLSRASIFNNPLIKKIFNALRMIPIYRIRDGWQSINKNNEVFRACYKLLNNKQSIIIFPEGDHHLNRRVRTLSKGFTRIVFGALENYKDLQIYIVPVGINYDSHVAYPQSISLYYGKAFLANHFYDADEVHRSTRQLIAKTSDELKKLTVHVEDLTTYEATISKLKMYHPDFLNPLETNNLLKNINKKSPLKPMKKSTNLGYQIIFILVILGSWLPFLIWKLLKPQINDPIFIGTFRFGIMVSLVPIFCLFQSFLIYLFFGLNMSIYFMVGCLSLSFLLKWMPHRYS